MRRMRWGSVVGNAGQDVGRIDEPPPRGRVKGSAAASMAAAEVQAQCCCSIVQHQQCPTDYSRRFAALPAPWLQSVRRPGS